MDTRQALGPAARPVTASNCEVVHLPGDRATITGTVGDVGQILARLQHGGRLVSATAPVPTGVPGIVLVNVRLVPRPRVQRQAPVRRRLSRRAVVAVAVGATTGVAMAGWLLLELLSAIVEHAAVIVGALLLVVVVLAVIGKAGGATFSGTFRGSMD